MPGPSLARRRSASARSARISSASTSCGCSTSCSWAARSSGPRSRSRRRLLGESGDAITPEAGERLADLEVTIAGLQGYEAEPQAAALLSGLGIEHARHDRPMRELSGGFRLRVLLAQALFAQPDLLLLDEPTNHLDIASIQWLEGYLREFPGAFVVVSHDRHFLNAVCNTIADLDYSELRLYSGDYDAFERAKELAVVQKDAEIARTEGRIEEMQQFIDRFRAKATKARQASARKKQVEKMELPEIRRSSRRTPGFEFGQARPSGRTPLRVSGLSKRYGEQTVLRDISFELQRGDRLAVVGPNGVGKSTLIKIISDTIEADEGTAELGYEARLGYFAQDVDVELRGEQSAFAWLGSATGESEHGKLRAVLGRMLFSGDDVHKRIGSLSGGESARLLLAALMLRQPNLLVLDEPTNHLDLEGREALMRALRDYPGTLVLRQPRPPLRRRRRHARARAAPRRLRGCRRQLRAVPRAARRRLPLQRHRGAAPGSPSGVRQRQRQRRARATPRARSSAAATSGSRAVSRSWSARSPRSRRSSRRSPPASPTTPTTRASRSTRSARTRAASAICRRGSTPRCAAGRRPRTNSKPSWGRPEGRCRSARPARMRRSEQGETPRERRGR